MNKQNLSIPLAIVIAGIIIAGSLFFTRKDYSNQNQETKDLPAAVLYDKAEEEKILRPVTDSDHILGNPDAEITIIEFSDTECPFCKKFHESMNQLMEEYGKTGKVRWVYRHFPFVMLHSQSQKEAEATECAAELGGNAKFWEYINRLYEITPSNNGLDLNELPKIAEYVGISKDAFEECLKNGRHAQDVESDLKDAVNLGVQGTPYSIIIAKDGKQFPISGYVSFQQLKTAIDQLVK